MRAPRFSLRLLFILTTLCAAVLGYFVCFEAPCYNPRQQEQDLLADELSNMGFNSIDLTWEELPSPPFAKLLGRKQGRRLTAVHLNFDSQVKVRPQGITSLMERVDQESDIERIEVEFGSFYDVDKVFHAEIPARTTHLRLYSVEVDQSDLDTIAELEHLKTLELCEISFENGEFQPSLPLLIANLPASVKELSFEKLDIPIEVAELVGRKSNVESLEISHCNFLSAGDDSDSTIPLAIIGPHCKRLNLRSMMLDRPFCEQIAHCKDLQRLDIYNCIFDVDDYQSLRTLIIANLPASLEELMLPPISLTSSDLQSLAKLKSLRELTITYDGPELSRDDVCRLSTSLTKLELDTDIPEQWLAALADHSQLEVITIHTDQKMPDTICDSILEINPKNFRDLGGMLSATAVRRLWDAGIEVNGPQQ